MKLFDSALIALAGAIAWGAVLAASRHERHRADNDQQHQQREQAAWAVMAGDVVVHRVSLSRLAGWQVGRFTGCSSNISAIDVRQGFTDGLIALHCIHRTDTIYRVRSMNASEFNGCIALPSMRNLQTFKLSNFLTLTQNPPTSLKLRSQGDRLVEVAPGADIAQRNGSASTIAACPSARRPSVGASAAIAMRVRAISCGPAASRSIARLGLAHPRAGIVAILGHDRAPERGEVMPSSARASSHRSAVASASSQARRALGGSSRKRCSSAR